jgi:hypothetical protein
VKKILAARQKNIRQRHVSRIDVNQSLPLSGKLFFQLIRVQLNIDNILSSNQFLKRKQYFE